MGRYGSGSNANDGERQTKLRLLARCSLSCCVAQFLTGRRQVPVHGPGVEDPCFKTPITMNTYMCVSLQNLSPRHVNQKLPEGRAGSVFSLHWEGWQKPGMRALMSDSALRTCEVGRICQNVQASCSRDCVHGPEPRGLLSVAQALQGSQLFSKKCPSLLPLPHSNVLGSSPVGFSIREAASGRGFGSIS